MIFYGNWKLNKTSKEVAEFFDSFNEFETQEKICFFVSPALIQTAVEKSYFPIGAQNVCYSNFGAYTGETSIVQALDLKCQSVLIGHSERRSKFFETDEIINKKLILCASQTECVLCVGETQEQLNEKYQVLEFQLLTALHGIEKQNLKNIIIAYEPVWAIGTGLTPHADEIQDTITFIKTLLKSKFDVNFKVLYGGSVNSKNVAEFRKIDNIDGFLIGGASLDAESFENLIKAQ